MSGGGSVCPKPINWSAATPNTRWVKDDEDDGDELGDGDKADDDGDDYVDILCPGSKHTGDGDDELGNGDKADDDDYVNTLCRGSKHIAVHWGSKMMVRMRISRHFGQ